MAAQGEPEVARNTIMVSAPTTRRQLFQLDSPSNAHDEDSVAWNEASQNHDNNEAIIVDAETPFHLKTSEKSTLGWDSLSEHAFSDFDVPSPIENESSEEQLNRTRQENVVLKARLAILCGARIRRGASVPNLASESCGENRDEDAEMENVSNTKIPRPVSAFVLQHKATILSMEKRIEELESTISLLNEENESQRRDQIQTADRLDQALADLDAAEALHEKVIQTLWDKTQEVTEVREENTSIRGENSRQGIELATAMQSVQQMADEVDAMEVELAAMKSQKQEDDELIDELRSATNSLAQEFQKVVIELTGSRKRVAGLEKELGLTQQDRDLATERALEQEMQNSRMNWAHVYASSTSPREGSNMDPDAASEALERLAQAAFALDELKCQSKLQPTSSANSDKNGNANGGSTSEGLKDVIAGDMKAWKGFLALSPEAREESGASTEVILPVIERLIACLSVKLSHVESECLQYQRQIEAAKTETVIETHAAQEKDTIRGSQFNSRNLSRASKLIEHGQAALFEMIGLSGSAVKPKRASLIAKSTYTPKATAASRKRSSSPRSAISSRAEYYAPGSDAAMLASTLDKVKDSLARLDTQDRNSSSVERATFQSEIGSRNVLQNYDLEVHNQSIKLSGQGATPEHSNGEHSSVVQDSPHKDLKYQSSDSDEIPASDSSPTNETSSIQKATDALASLAELLDSNLES